MDTAQSSDSASTWVAWSLCKKSLRVKGRILKFCGCREEGSAMGRRRQESEKTNAKLDGLEINLTVDLVAPHVVANGDL